jgi:gas vesicle protein
MSRDNNGFGWFLAGLGLGALVGVLYAPKSGRETRQSLVDAAEEGRDFVVTKGRQAREQAGQYTERGKEVLAAQKEQFKAAYDAGVQAYREKTESKV